MSADFSTSDFMREQMQSNLEEVLEKRPRLELSSDTVLNERLHLIKIVSNRLFFTLALLLTVMIIGGYLVFLGGAIKNSATAGSVLLIGFIGGFVGLQRRMKSLAIDDLTLLAHSWVYIALSPMVGGILAMLLLVLFIGGLLEGGLFPQFDPDPVLQSSQGTTLGISTIFNIHGASYQDYAKLMFWCFLAGYSEHFVTNIISHFESSTGAASVESRSGDMDV